MVDFKLLFYPQIVRNSYILRRRGVSKLNQSISSNLDNVADHCSCKRCQIIGFNDSLDVIDYNTAHIKKRHILGSIALLIVIALIIGIYYAGAFGKSKGSEDGVHLTPANPTKPLPPSNSVLRVFKRAAVCADSVVCAQVGKEILDKNGSAVDAVIATMFCNGVVTMQSMGLGGGFLMTIYKKNEGKAYFLNAREKAPLAAKNELYKKDDLISRNGPLAIAVPGELKGYWTLYKKFGTLDWKDLVQPAIDICNKGYIMTQHQYNSLFKNKLNQSDLNFKEWFKDKNNDFRKIGSKIVPTKLCQTLTLISTNGGDDLYNGTLAKMFLKDMADIGGLITAEDLEKYEAEWMDPITTKFESGDKLFTSPPPGSGAILSLIMGILDGYKFDRNSIEDINSTVLTYHRIVEAFKYAYAKRTELGDTNFVNITELLGNLTSREYARDIRDRITDDKTFTDPKHYGAIFYTKPDHGTAHISIIDENGDAVSATSSINLFFGSGMTSTQTGIIYNSVMDDFSFPYFKNYFGLPGSPNNEMLPEKRPLSSMSPTILVDKNEDVKMVVGASGGTVITTSVAWTIIRSIWFGDNIKEAIDSPRIHHQLYPMQIMYEYGMLQQIVDGLRALGHAVHRDLSSVVCALKKEKDYISANADYRKGGDVYGLT
ncbi:scoloptoxin SSD14-like isoform X1 [Euwallacea fornicatus]|uniref:scoloptoxin SSD14-like isoform X1 n=1 Tax=Euwallacea fornicatus TaxID=995702 RepID=UPI00338FDFBD